MPRSTIFQLYSEYISVINILAQICSSIKPNSRTYLFIFQVSTLIILLLSRGRYLCWWSITRRGYHPSDSLCLALAWFIRYIHLQTLLYNAITIETEVFFQQT